MNVDPLTVGNVKTIAGPAVRDYMTAAPQTISPRRSLREARGMMDLLEARHLPVEDAGVLVGVLSARDLDTVSNRSRVPAASLTVAEAMTPAPYAVTPDAPLGDVAGEMDARDIDAAVVVDGGRIVGLFTAFDALRALHEHLSAGQRPDPAERVRRNVIEHASLPERIGVDEAIAAVMETLVLRVTVGEAHALREALPAALRSSIDKAVAAHDERPALRLGRPAFVALVAERLGLAPSHAELVCATVFAAVRSELSLKTVRDVCHQLPASLGELWLSTPPTLFCGDVTAPPLGALASIERELEAAHVLPSRLTSEAAVAAVICALAERLSGGEARELLFGLPAPVRLLVERCVRQRTERPAVFGHHGLFDRVADALHVDAAEADALVRAVLPAVRRLLPSRAVMDIASQLPADLRALWER